jgi:hypothetical protein
LAEGARQIAGSQSGNDEDAPVSSPSDNQEPLLSPKEAIDYLRQRYGLPISLASFYTLISRGDSPNVTYFRNRPKFTKPDIDEWVRRNISDARQ